MANRKSASTRSSKDRRKPGGSTSTGRVTPKGGGHGTRPTRTAEASSRYTPPVPKSKKVSPRWVPVLMFGLLLLGTAVIVLNYLGLLPTKSGDASNVYLLLGLALITGGFITATQYH